MRACVLLALVALPALAQAEEPSPHEIVVRGSLAPGPLAELPWSLTVVTPEELAGGRPQLSLAELTLTIPGLVVQDRTNYAQDLRLSIRGFGARSGFGVRGVQVIVDGIPLTGADGQTQLDSIDPQAVTRIEVLRGPAGALYGNAAGGVLRLDTADGGEPGLRASSTVARFGTWRAAVAGQTEAAFVQASRVVTYGHRSQMDAEEVAGRGSFTVELPGDWTLRTMVHALHSPEADDPGGLTADERDADPWQAAPASIQWNTGEEVDQGQLGLRAASDDAGLELAAWGLARGYDGRIPQRRIELERGLAGASARWTWDQAASAWRSRLSVGGQWQEQRDERRNFLIEDGARVLDQGEDVRGLGAWLQEQLHATDWLVVTAGGRADAVRFVVDDHVGDASEQRWFTALSGMAGAVVAPRDSWQVYANVAQSFETPTTTELASPGIEPTRALSLEAGARAAAGSRVAADVAVFRIGLTDEIVPYEDDTGRTVYRNAGRSHRVGAELALSARPVSSVRLVGSLSWLEARFDDMIVADMQLAGNRVPGIRPWRAAAEAAWGEDQGPYAGATLEVASGAHVDDANTARAGAFTRLGARAGWRGTVADLDVDLFAGADNLLDQRFDDNLRVNAFGGRYHEPAPPLQVWTGLELGWRYHPGR